MFGAYCFWGEGLSGKVKEFVIQLVVTRDEQASFAEAKCVTFLERVSTSIALALEVEGGNIVTVEELVVN